jgi:hypothetical protein
LAGLHGSFETADPLEATGAEGVFYADFEGRSGTDVGLLDEGGGGAFGVGLGGERGVTFGGEREGLRKRERLGGGRRERERE